MQLDFIIIYTSLDFLTESIRLQYTNFIYRHRDRINEYLTFEDVVNRLRQEEPIEYVFNLAEFFGNELYVDKRCLIPRHETEELVQRAIDYVNRHPDERFTCVDTGTGSGCIIHSVAKAVGPTHHFVGIDVSEGALEVAGINRTAFGLESIVELQHISFQDLDFSQYDNLIVCSNLPYVPDNEELQPSVTQYEPHLALFGGARGDELNNELIARIEKLPNLRAFYMEGYNGSITTIVER
jgi:release factor glutamine methyltransferase